MGLGERYFLHVHPTGETTVRIHHEEASEAGLTVLP